MVTGITGAWGKTKRTGPTASRLELLRHRHEIVAIGTQAVQHDDRGNGQRTGFDIDGFKFSHWGVSPKTGSIAGAPLP